MKKPEESRFSIINNMRHRYVQVSLREPNVFYLNVFFIYEHSTATQRRV